MREILWLRLRTLPFLRRLYAIRALAGPMKSLSFLLVPSRGTRTLRVRSGPGKGLVYELNPRWETRMWDGSYELAVQKVLQEKLTPGSVFYDVGANFGFYSLLAARQGAQVFAFEPDPRIGESLERHARLNSLEAKIEIIRAAVFSTSGSIGLEPASGEAGHGNAHVGPARDASRPTVEVLCTTLDDFAQGHPAPDIIKIDVEGAESEVLKGAEKVFAESRPHLLCEVHDPVNASFVEAWLTARGYGIHWLDENDKLPRQLLATPR
jgi:FkbM family methyltransferase